MKAKRYRWDELERDCPMDLIEWRRIVGERMMISEVLLKKGCHVPSHSHENEQIACVMSGELLFGIGEKEDGGYSEVTVKGGEVIHLPSNIPHSATAIEESLVLDLFSPPSEKAGVDR